MSSSSLQTFTTLDSVSQSILDEDEDDDLRICPKSNLKHTPKVERKNLHRRRVSFHDEVLVRLIDQHNHPSNDSISDAESDDLSEYSDEIEPLATDGHSGYRASDDYPKNSSLDNIIEDIGLNVVEDTETHAIASTSTPQILTPLPNLTSEEQYAQMDLYLRLTYPNYYNFLKSHIITGAVGTEEFTSQTNEFKEAILGCYQFPSEYFEDLEHTFVMSEKLSNGKK
ncbi:hypothetical protein HHI36_006991 [Cryptolaemus montrouzieri]|uniref:Uncharacterized protein n=1 Tax=Cryptolaemus montrouzieri TaxID=559131 RepID=A0ABD2MN75_9CUCU